MATAALLACVTVGTAPAVGAVPAVGALPAAPDPEGGGQSRERQQVALVLDKVTPKTAGPSGAQSKISVSGRVENRSGHALPGLKVRLRTSAQRMTSRNQLAQYAAGQPSSLRGLAAEGQLAQAAGAGGKAAFSLGTTTATIGLQAFGVYPLGVEVVNQYGQVLTGVNTFITFVPKQRDFRPLSVGWIWPMIDRQHRTTDDTFLDDQLATDLAPGGRLAGLVDAAATTKTPVTWSIDPALIDDVQTMAAAPYLVKGPRNKKGTRKPKSTAAAAWLNSLKTASKNDPYFALPYADPDAVALVRNKMSNHLSIAYANSGGVNQALGRPPVQMAWPPSGMAGHSTLNELAKRGRLGNGAFVMSSAAFADPTQGYTPGATTRLETEEGPKKTVVYDETLNRIVSADTRSPGAAVLAEQRFLAETAMITAEAPVLARSLVIAPDRRWNPSPQFAKNLLTYTAAASWMAETPLEKIANAAPLDRVYRGYPDAMEGYELGRSYLDRVAEISRRAARFSSIMVEPVTVSYRRAVLRMESTAWRGRNYRRAVEARRVLSERLDDDMGRVRVLIGPAQRVTLAGNSGRIPLTIANELSNQTIRVRLEAVPEKPAQLQIGKFDDEVIELGPGQKQTLSIPMRAAGNGKVRVNLRLTSADRRTFGSKHVITVRSTGYGRVALLITGGGLAVLFVGVGVRAMRARRRRKAEAAGDGATGVGPVAAGPPGPGIPGAAEPGVPGGPGASPGAGPGPFEPFSGGTLPGGGAGDFRTPTDAAPLPAPTAPAAPSTTPSAPAASPVPAAPSVPAGPAGPAGSAEAAEPPSATTGPLPAAPGPEAGSGPGTGTGPGPEAGAGSPSGVRPDAGPEATRNAGDAGQATGGRRRSGNSH
nr:hypothetical protein GCM10010200_043690 [Actinomadura rugatobispora]